MSMSEEPAVDHDQLWSAFRQRYPLQRRTIGGREWYYITAGTGTAWVVLLPGALGVADTSFHYILAFAARYRVLSLDYPPTISRVEPLLADMAALLTAAGATHVHLVGGSYSGPIAHAFAQRYPTLVRSLILANTGLPRRRRLLDGYALLLIVLILPTPVLQGLMQWSLRWFLPTGTALARFWQAYFRALLPTLSQQWLCNRLRIFLDLTARGPERSAWVGPVLVVDARQENLFTAEEQARLRAFYPQAEQVTIDMAGHGSALKALDAHITAYAAFLEQAATDR
jgi:pimeloyl-ACP methyl ester carboxylesterase